MGGRDRRAPRGEQGQPATSSIVDLTDKLGKIDIQGPAAIKIMQKVLKTPEAVFDKLTYFSVQGPLRPEPRPSPASAQLLDGTPLLLSRSGYTGEVGFEIFVEGEHNVRIWELLMEAGREFGLIACGLAARDSLRTGAVLPLSHQDIGHWTYIHHPWPFALPFDAAGRRVHQDVPRIGGAREGRRRALHADVRRQRPAEDRHARRRSCATCRATRSARC